MTKNLKLEVAREVYREKLTRGEIKRLNPIEKAKANPKSLRAAINAKCFDCCCGQVEEVRNCTCTDCSLWNLRPYQ